jgi:hypothetical protein
MWVSSAVTGPATAEEAGEPGGSSELVRGLWRFCRRALPQIVDNATLGHSSDGSFVSSFSSLSLRLFSSLFTSKLAVPGSIFLNYC